MSSQWNYWQKSNWGRTKGANQNKGAGKQKKEETKESKPAFPAYDGAFSASSSSTSPSNAGLSDQVIGLLQQLATKDKDMAEAISAVITPEPTDQELLKVQQRKLNHMRKLQTKIYKKEKSIKDKEASMSKFLVDVRKHIESEKLRHKQETDLLAKELQELKDQLQKAKEGKDEGADEQMEDLDELLDEPDQEKAQLRDRLAQAEQANYAMQQQLKLFQGQMTEFMHTGRILDCQWGLHQAWPSHRSRRSNHQWSVWTRLLLLQIPMPRKEMRDNLSAFHVVGEWNKDHTRKRSKRMARKSSWTTWTDECSWISGDQSRRCNYENCNTKAKTLGYKFYAWKEAKDAKGSKGRMVWLGMEPDMPTRCWSYCYIKEKNITMEELNNWWASCWGIQQETLQYE